MSPGACSREEVYEKFNPETSSLYWARISDELSPAPLNCDTPGALPVSSEQSLTERMTDFPEGLKE